MNTQPVALQYSGRAYFNHPGWKKYYKKVVVDLGAEKDAPVEDGEKVQRYLTNNGYRRMYLKRGKGSAVDFTEIWMHERYVGAGGQPGDFEAESLAQLREYIGMAVASRDKEEEADAPSLEKFDAPVQQPALDMSIEAVRERIAASLAAVLAEHGLTTPTTEAVGEHIADTLTL